MASFSNNYQLLINKLDEFIRKYYINQLIRGSLYTLTFILGFYLLISLAEYFFYFSTTIRIILFYSFLIFTGLSLFIWVISPLMHYFRLGKVIDHTQAAKIIGTHFSNVQDRLLNILDLRNQSNNASNKDLIEASINQKIESLKPIPFTAAVNLGQNKKYLKYAAIPVIMIFFILFSAPNILKESNARLINNNVKYVPKAPFEFNVTNAKMEAIQYEDFDLEVKVNGDVLPNEVYAVSGSQRYKLDKKNANTFDFSFKKLQKDVDFYLTASGFDSRMHTIKVLPKPMIINFSTRLDYPEYTGRKDEMIKNIGDLIVPAGTKVIWDFNARNTDNISLGFADEQIIADKRGEETFSLDKVLMADSPYKIYVHNKKINGADSIGYMINVVPDKYPMINVEQFEDSINRKYLFFHGEASDDYGLRNIAFAYKIIPAGSSGPEDFKVNNIRVSGQDRSLTFNHSWDINTLNIKPGDQLKYYFIVWDNDAVNGSKYSKTPTMSFEMPTKDEFKEMTKQSNEEIKKDLERNMKDAKKLNKEIKELQEKLLQKKNMSWEDSKAIENLFQKQQNLQENIQKTKEKYEKNLREQSEYKNNEEKITEKQKKLQELFDEMLTEEMKKMMEEMEKLMEKMNQEKAMDELEQFEMNNEQLEKELDRMLELFKQLELEQKMEDIINDLNELAEEQDDLKKETEEGQQDKEKLSEKQEELNKKFDDLQKEMDEMNEMNDEMESPKDLDDNDEIKKDIEENMEKSLDQLQQNQKKKAGESQKNASDQMKKMAQKMSSQMSSMQMDQMMLDMKALQQLLDNLIKLSFDQEKLIEDIKATTINTPKYVELVQKQHKLKKDAKMVEDSLTSLSKRIFQISSYVNKEIAAINHHMDKSIEMLAERRKPEAGARQQYVMTGMNNLALMLDEIMQAMQQQMASQMMGNQMCQMPMKGKGQKPMDEMGKMQQQLNEQLKKMQGQMKQGKGQGQMSKELAEMAARQSAIRKALKEINNKNNKDGKGSLGDLEKLADEMEKTEEDIVNKRITEQTLRRQEEIMVRLLEAADAERQRETSPERESQSPEKISKKIPPSLEDYLKKREAEVDLYKTVPPSLKPFYKKLVENYFKSISSHN